ncbi:MAG: LytTR family DNA-binding domain-containing protein [Pseudomonadota bacterium]
MSDTKIAVDTRNSILFYLMVPMGIALFFALSGAGNQPITSFSEHIAYWTVSVGLCWLILSLSTGFIAPLMRRMNAPLTLTLMTGYCIGSPIYSQAQELRNFVLQEFVLERSTLLPAAGLEGPYASIYLFLLGSTLWITSNYFFYFFLGAERFGYKPTSYDQRGTLAALAIAEGQPFARKVSGDTSQTHFLGVPLTTITFLEADDHYTKIGLQTGTKQYHLRFSDAVRAIDPTIGMQVHRSYWVAFSAVERMYEKGHKAELLLTGGKRIPVSRTYRQNVREKLNLSI